MIAYILGWILKLEGLFMLIPILVAVIYREHNGIWFVVVAACSLALENRKIISFICGKAVLQRR